MTFTLAQIDRAMEWRVKDEVIKKGYWPDQRAFLIAGDEPGFQSALDAMGTVIEVFGQGHYKDREQLRANNVVIDRVDIYDGSVGASYPYRFEYDQVAGNFNKYRTGEGTNNVEYQIRFVCDDVDLERAITQIMLNAFPNKVHLKGINDDDNLTETEDGFWVFRLGPAVDISGSNFIEKIWRLEVSEVDIQEQTLVQADIPPVTQIDIFTAPGGDKDQDESEWSTDPETVGGQLKVPKVSAASVESGAVNDLVVTFDQEITVSPGNDLTELPVSFQVDGSPKTDLATVTLSSNNEITFTFTGAFNSGETITWTYVRDLGGEAIVDKVNGVEMEYLKDGAVVNNL